MKTLFLDIDGPLSTNNFNGIDLDPECVKVLNEIIDRFNPNLVISSDWKDHHDIDEMNVIFAWNKVKKKISAFTPNLWGIDFHKSSQLEECRAKEILKFIEKNNIKEFIVVDDLNLTPWFGDNFVLVRDFFRGIANEIIKEKLMNKFEE
jgi:hypothetical protein